MSWDTIIGKSEDVTPINNMIIIDPISFFWEVNAKYYRTFSPTVVGGLGANYGWFNGILNNGSSYGINAEVRFYPSKKAPHGFYLAPNIAFNIGSGQEYAPDANGNYGTTTATATSMTIGGMFGWQWFPSDNFCIGLALGFNDYIHVSGPSDILSIGTIFGSTITGILPALRFDIGYGW